MTRIGIIRCEKNESTCPLTGCLKCLDQTSEGFGMYDAAHIAGVFTCRCPGQGVGDMARILKAKGAEAIHFCTCTFASRCEGEWVMDKGGFCSDVDSLIAAAQAASGLPCRKGTAHLPRGFVPEAGV